jgi:hypothetical protein
MEQARSDQGREQDGEQGDAPLIRGPAPWTSPNGDLARDWAGAAVVGGWAKVAIVVGPGSCLSRLRIPERISSRCNRCCSVSKRLKERWLSLPVRFRALLQAKRKRKPPESPNNGACWPPIVEASRHFPLPHGGRAEGSSALAGQTSVAIRGRFRSGLSVG